MAPVACAEFFRWHRDQRQKKKTKGQSTMDIAKTYARIFGFVALLIGILGFVPGISSGGGGSGYLLGIFAINPLHNVIHIVTGLVGIFAGYYANGSFARLYALVFGVVYALVTVLGFTPLVMDGNLLGLIPVNMADNVLHLRLPPRRCWSTSSPVHARRPPLPEAAPSALPFHYPLPHRRGDSASSVQESAAPAAHHEVGSVYAYRPVGGYGQSHTRGRSTLPGACAVSEPR